jgi:hypothetical protein
VTKMFNIGDRVEWTSQGGGISRKKVGEIVQIVPALERPDIKGWGNIRGHESYVVRVKGKGRYWPRVSQLRLDTSVEARR